MNIFDFIPQSPVEKIKFLEYDKFMPDELTYAEGRKIYLKPVPEVKGKVARIDGDSIVIYLAAPEEEERTYVIPHLTFDLYFSFEDDKSNSWYNKVDFYERSEEAREDI